MTHAEEIKNIHYRCLALCYGQGHRAQQDVHNLGINNVTASRFTRAMEIPKILIDQIRDGQVVLFLGAGASIGASHKSNQQPPVGKELGKIIANKFLGAEFVERPLDQTVYYLMRDSVLEGN